MEHVAGSLETNVQQQVTYTTTSSTLPKGHLQCTRKGCSSATGAQPGLQRGYKQASRQVNGTKQVHQHAGGQGKQDSRVGTHPRLSEACSAVRGVQPGGGATGPLCVQEALHWQQTSPTW